MTQKSRPDTDPPTDLPVGGEIGPEVERRDAFADALAREGYTDVLVLHRTDARELVTKRRLAILDHLRENRPESVSALADALGYDVGDVSRDLDLLARYDVTERVTEGRRRVPRLKHRHVVLEPLV